MKHFHNLVLAAAIALGPQGYSVAATTEPVASLAPRPMEPHTVLSRAIALKAELVAAGLLTASVDVALNEDPDHKGSPAYALIDFKLGVCSLRMDPAALSLYGFDEPMAFRFMVHHELAHCELYMNPKTRVFNAALDDRSNMMLSDLLDMEFFLNGNTARVNGFNAYHETYADLRAIATMLKTGATDQDVARVIAYRKRFSGHSVDPHDTSSILERLMENASKERAGPQPWVSMSPLELDERVRSVADQHAPRAFFIKVFGGAGIFQSSSLLEASLRAPLSDLRFEFTAPVDRAFAQGRLEQARHSPNPAWHAFSKAVDAGGSDRQIIDAFFKSRYGASVAELAESDPDISRALSVGLVPSGRVARATPRPRLN